VKTKRILEIPYEIPEARRDKISKLKKAIREGTYQIRADQIATKIVKDLLLEFAVSPNVYKSRGCRNN
jgi:anti-sigma28 factor (negative regulator of flagellin synthesis)